LTGLVYTPLDFLHPFISARERFAQGAPEWFGLAWVFWTLPFLWIALSMSVRRSIDAGTSPWHGLWMLVPLANIPTMLLLACLPSSAYEHELPEVASQSTKASVEDVTASVWSVIGGLAIGALYASVVIQASIYMLNSYGAVLFFGTPLMTGTASSYLVNLRASRSWSVTLGVAIASVFFSSVGLLLFAIEGAICLVMAAPIMLPLAALGAPLGKFLADRRRRNVQGLVSCLCILPLLAAVESRLPSSSEFVVAGSIEIDAPPADVWRQVIAFPEIEERPDWFFRLGISCPTGARITGDGVGATRECVFTTGRFIEPITAWDAPQRLAFDVREQPAPMFELTPYRHIHPPHLDSAFRSTRGEFELVKLPGGRTRLVGRTWYTLDIRPHAYWTIWTDWIVHRIHHRVLRHIKRLAER
ncbi:MAG TPA: SRPBCC family protein, partial [Lacipirellulaceae bacterium]|nr:SRPBCC family protein [Lacipirellulaceae bacterium]